MDVINKQVQSLLLVLIVLNVSAQKHKFNNHQNTKSLLYAELAWNFKGENIYFMSGNVGIGTKFPASKMEIIGNDSDFDGNVQHGVLTIKNNNYSRFRAEGYSDTFFRNPQFMGVRGRGTWDNPQDALPGDRILGIYANTIENKKLKDTPVATIEFYMGDKPSSGEITFSTLSANAQYRDERMKIDQNGNIGIGTSEPITKLHVANGDIYIEDISKGIIMKSPNGQCWRGTVDDSGNLNFVKINCPDSEINAVVPDSILLQSIHVFPNPTNRNLNIEVKNANKVRLQYNITSLQGQKILSGFFNSSAHKVDISKLPAALYLITFLNDRGEQLVTEKFVKNELK